MIIHNVQWISLCILGLCTNLSEKCSKELQMCISDLFDLTRLARYVTQIINNVLRGIVGSSLEIGCWTLWLTAFCSCTESFAKIFCLLILIILFITFLNNHISLARYAPQIVINFLRSLVGSNLGIPDVLSYRHQLVVNFSGWHRFFFTFSFISAKVVVSYTALEWTRKFEMGICTCTESFPKSMFQNIKIIVQGNSINYFSQSHHGYLDIKLYKYFSRLL